MHGVEARPVQAARRMGVAERCSISTPIAQMKPSKLATDGGDGLLLGLAATHQAQVARMQSMLGLPRYRRDGGRGVFLPHGEDRADGRPRCR